MFQESRVQYFNVIIQIKDDEMGEACSMHGSDEECKQNLSGNPGYRTAM
jgi:hypothetical protein